ncbi:MAG: protein translocase subunit SecF [Xanthomonadales bacterium]|nr:protein translocase subunit SecF [Xanthomonadales bacterium]
MELFSKQTNIDFIRRLPMAYVLSALLIIISIGSLATRSLNFGLDFTGGTLIQLQYADAPEINDIRTALSDGGFDDAVVQTFGTTRDIVVRIAPRGDTSSADLSTQVVSALRSSNVGEMELGRVEFVGPQIGSELRDQGGLAMVYVLIGILIYIAMRFQWRFSLGAVLALVHDLVITFGFLSVFQVEFDLTVVAAILAVLGYSLNDTIVVFDRIRENFRTMRKGGPKDVINTSVNQTLSRTIMTSCTTLIVLIVLFYLGGSIIHAFAYTLIIGVLIGTYSSIFVASAAVLKLGVSKQDLIPVQKEGEALDEMP